MSDFNETEEKIKKAFSKSAEVTKNAFTKASSAVQAFSDKSVTKIEVLKLNNSLKNKYQEMGECLSDLLSVKGADFSNLQTVLSKPANAKISDKIKALQKEILQLKKDIKERK